MPPSARSPESCSRGTFYAVGETRIGRRAFATVLLAVSVVAISFSAVHSAENAAEGNQGKLVTLERIYLSCHGLSWINVTKDDPRRVTTLWEQWPGRCDLVHPRVFEHRLRVWRLLRNARPNEGLFIIPGEPRETRQIVAFAAEHFGPRCVVMDLSGDAASPKATGLEFNRGLEADRRRAVENRPAGMTDEQFNGQVGAWRASKAWAVDLKEKLHTRGYTFDPATVKIVCFGSDWRGCAATYPIQMGRAWGLAEPIERRWDLIMHDWGPLDVTSTVVVQNVRMPAHVRLFVFKSERGRYCAEYWEGLHGPMDRPHVVTLEFPPGSVRVIDLFGRAVSPGHRTFGPKTPQGRTIYPPKPGDGNRRYGRLTVNVGFGHRAVAFPDIVEAGPDLSLDDFYAALVAGNVAEVQ